MESYDISFKKTNLIRWSIAPNSMLHLLSSPLSQLSGTVAQGSRTILNTISDDGQGLTDGLAETARQAGNNFASASTYCSHSSTYEIGSSRDGIADGRGD